MQQVHFELLFYVVWVSNLILKLKDQHESQVTFIFVNNDAWSLLW